jgi:bacterioferritin (cytochrome b1)
MMAARGMVPVKGGDLVLLLAQLTVDADPTVSQSAGDTLQELPDAVLLPACDEDLHAAIFHEVALRFSTHDEVLARLAQNHAVADATIATISTYCPERITEIISVNQQRLLGAPQIIEALYKNRNTRMSTADRLIELAARHEVDLTGIPMFDELKKAIQGQLIPEASEEPLPTDDAFSKALEEDADQDAVERDKVDGTEETKEEFVSLLAKIREMNVGEKIRLALLGNAAARSMLVRDPNRVVCMAAIASPAMGESEAKNAAQSREVSEDVLRFIAKKREWIRNYEIKRHLCNNPKTPLALSMTFLAHLRRNDLRALSRSRGVPGPLKQAAKRRAKNFES